MPSVKIINFYSNCSSKKRCFMLSTLSFAITFLSPQCCNWKFLKVLFLVLIARLFLEIIHKDIREILPSDTIMILLHDKLA